MVLGKLPVLIIWIIIGQGPIALAVGVGGGCFDIFFSLIYHFSFLSPNNLDYNRARAYCACSKCGWGCFDIFSLSITSLFFLPLSGRWSDID